MKKIMTILAGLILIVTAIAFADSHDVSDDVLDGAEAATPANWTSDKLVWKTGTIEAKNDGGVNINDIGYRWSPYGTNFRGIDGTTLTSGDFSKGTEVTFVLDRDRKTIVTVIKGNVSEDE